MLPFVAQHPPSHVSQREPSAILQRYTAAAYDLDQFVVGELAGIRHIGGDQKGGLAADLVCDLRLVHASLRHELPLLPRGLRTLTRTRPGWPWRGCATRCVCTSSHSGRHLSCWASAAWASGWQAKRRLLRCHIWRFHSVRDCTTLRGRVARTRFSPWVVGTMTRVLPSAPGPLAPPGRELLRQCAGAAYYRFADQPQTTVRYCTLKSSWGSVQTCSTAKPAAPAIAAKSARRYLYELSVQMLSPTANENAASPTWTV